MLIDGAPMMNSYGSSTGSVAGTTLGVEGIREFKVITNNFSAEYGMTMGSQMTIVSKNGSNQFHGSAFEYLRNAALDARNYFAPTPAQLGGRRNPQFQRNNFGGAFGGPIQKDKTFFFATYEALRENLGVPFLNVTLGAGCRGGVGTVITNTACPQLGATPSVTIGSRTPLVAQFLKLFPLPNQAGNIYNFAFTQPTIVNFGQIRADHNFSEKDTFFGRYTIDDSNRERGRNFLVYTDPQESRNQFLTLSETHIFSPTLLNTGRLSLSRTLIHANTANHWADFGVQPVVFSPGMLTLGGISVTGVDSIAPDCCSPSISGQDTYTFSDDVFYTHGRHSFKFGTLANYFRRREELGTGQGSLTFRSIDQFLQGIPSGFSGRVPGAIRDNLFTYNSWGFYLQDDVRTSSRLTLNLGLRYEFITTLTPRNSHSAAIINPATDQFFTKGPPFENPSLTNVSPRFGFAWDVLGTGKTAVRSGVGLLYDVASFNAMIGALTAGVPPDGLGYSVSFLPGDATATFTIPFTVDLNRIVPSATNIDYHLRQPKMVQYNLTIEQQLPWSSVLTVAYAGSRGYDLFGAFDGNPYNNNVIGTVTNGIGCDGNPAPSYIPNGSPCYKPAVAIPATDPTAACVNAVVNACRVNKYWQGWRTLQGYSSSWYDSLQVSLNKRLSNGLQLQSAYTFAKALDTSQSQGVIDGNGNAGAGASVESIFLPNPLFGMKGPSSYDVRQSWRFNTLYRLPNVVQGDGFLGKTMNGWWLGSIVSINTGYPFTPTLANNRPTYAANPGGGLNRPEIVRPGQAGAPCSSLLNPNGKTEVFDPDRVITGNPRMWFNPCMFMDTPFGYPSTLGRNTLRGPNFRNWDFSVNKDTRLVFLGEQGILQFRAEVFNILNRPNFSFPNTATFAGTGAAAGGPVENPITGAALITQTINNNRQIQFALRIGF
jgi:hypothetical protein